MTTHDAVSEELYISAAQVYVLVLSGDLPAIKIGGRGIWRVERCKLEEWITKQYAATQRASEVVARRRRWAAPSPTTA